MFRHEVRADSARRRKVVPAESHTADLTPASPSPCAAILVIDDHPIVREGLKRVLERGDAHWTVAEASGGDEALALMRQQAFDLAVVDVSMPRMTGLEFLRRARLQAPAMRVLMVSMHSDEQYAFRAFRMGANGYVTKDSAATDLAEAVRRIQAGGTYVSAELSERMVLNLSDQHGNASHTQLSDREFDVMRRLAAGRRPTEIAEALHISVKTVSTYKRRILDRMQLATAASLTRYAIEHGLLDDEVGPGFAD